MFISGEKMPGVRTKKIIERMNECFSSILTSPMPDPKNKCLISYADFVDSELKKLDQKLKLEKLEINEVIKKLNDKNDKNRDIWAAAAFYHFLKTSPISELVPITTDKQKPVKQKHIKWTGNLVHVLLHVGEVDKDFEPPFHNIFGLGNPFNYPFHSFESDAKEETKKLFDNLFDVLNTKNLTKRERDMLLKLKTTNKFLGKIKNPKDAFTLAKTNKDFYELIKTIKDLRSGTKTTKNLPIRAAFSLLLNISSFFLEKQCAFINNLNVEK